MCVTVHARDNGIICVLSVISTQPLMPDVRLLISVDTRRNGAENAGIYYVIMRRA